MKSLQKEFNLRKKNRGFHLITDEILLNLPEIKDFEIGTLNLFIKHTSASLTINENCDPTVRSDMENFINDVVSNKSYFKHTYEGDDDMPAHIKSSLFGVSLTIPITNGQLNMGTWQGIYLGEHRDFGGSRKIVSTIIGK
ncbi:secondary thiamine-phosphate synthase enzyme YjbQ [Arcobacter arenosus]|uniref:YjbQ family protein n=1 Tax=Arcobacter arenosus TaxID=2576037 RepID=A0A5R8Y3Z0_9BACT|nr:secondary thiamine-phosphate synthase enzyme YjbQ [Arcobacter arenosus]TLP40786.1 YjbQ family protein [Arcobacter arenosus]